MKNKNRLAVAPLLTAALAGLATVSATFAASATWDGGGGTNAMNTATNWTGDVLPNQDGDTATWDGTVPGNLSLDWGGGFGPGFGSTQGVHLGITGTNTGSLLLNGTGNFGLGNVSIASNAGAFTFGNGGGTGAGVVFRPNTNNSTFTNNSSATATFGSNLVLNSGGGTLRTLTFGGSGNWQFNAPLTLGGAGDLAFAKEGTGTLTFGSTAVGNRVAASSVSGGMMLINGSVTSAAPFTVNTGGTLGGSGSVAGTVTVNAGGIISPGTSPGNFTIGGGLTLAGSYIWELGALSTANAGTDFDTITLSGGNLTLVDAALVLALGAFAPSGDSFWQTEQTWAGIVNNTGAGTAAGAFEPIDNSPWQSLGSFSTTVVDNDVNLVWTPIPEPGTAFLAAIAGGLGLLRRRRR